MKRVPAGALEDVVARRIVSLAQDKELLMNVIAEANDTFQKENENLQEQRSLQKNFLQPIEQKIENIVQFIAEGKIYPTLAQKLAELELQKQQIETELEKITSEQKELRKQKLDVDFIKEGLEVFDKMWNVASCNEKRDLLHLFVHKVIWMPDKIKMGLYKVSPTSEFFFRPSVNQNNGFAVNRLNWLPELDSNQRPSD